MMMNPQYIEINREDTNTMDLSLEKQELLEATQERFGFEIRRSGVKRITRTFALFLFLVIIIIAYYEGIFPELEIFIEKCKNNQYWFLIALFFPVVLMWQLVVGVKDLLSPPPLAGESPQETIKQYYNGLMIYLDIKSGKIESQKWLQSYICLLDQAKNIFKSYHEYIYYWKNVAQKIKEDVRKNIKSKNISRIRCKIHHVELISRHENVKTFQITIKADAVDIVYRDLSMIVESVYYLETVQLVNIGKRWYISSPFWTGKVISKHSLWQ